MYRNTRKPLAAVIITTVNLSGLPNTPLAGVKAAASPGRASRALTRIVDGQDRQDQVPGRALAFCRSHSATM